MLPSRESASRRIGSGRLGNRSNSDRQESDREYGYKPQSHREFNSSRFKEREKDHDRSRRSHRSEFVLFFYFKKTWFEIVILPGKSAAVGFYGFQCFWIIKYQLSQFNNFVYDKDKSRFIGIRKMCYALTLFNAAIWHSICFASAFFLFIYLRKIYNHVLLVFIFSLISYHLQKSIWHDKCNVSHDLLIPQI